jgi:hypothetical protein
MKSAIESFLSAERSVPGALLSKSGNRQAAILISSSAATNLFCYEYRKNKLPTGQVAG